MMHGRVVPTADWVRNPIFLSDTAHGATHNLAGAVVHVSLDSEPGAVTRYTNVQIVAATFKGGRKDGKNKIKKLVLTIEYQNGINGV